MAHVSESKKQVVKEIAELLHKYPVIGVVNMTNLPTKSVQGMRAKLRESKTILRMTKKTLMSIALEHCKKDKVKELENSLEGMPALIFTTENPFKLYSDLQKTKTKAAAKAGQKAPKDIVVSAGPTSFSPGPVIGQLGKYGIKTGIEAGKIVIKQDSVVAKKGDTISRELAGILTRLGIEPMEIGLDLVAVYENSTIYKPDVLYVDETAYAKKICTAYNEVMSLAVYAAYLVKDTINLLLGKAHNDAKSLALARSILTSETTADILKKAYLEMLSLSNSLPAEALSDELKASMAAVTSNNSDSKEYTAHAEKEHKEEKKEKDAAVGLGSLFG